MAPFFAGLDVAFQSDDYIAISHFADPGLRFERILGEFTGPQYGLENPRFYRPIASASLALDHCIWGIAPFGFHLSNVLLHGMSAGLVFLIGWALFQRRAAALVSALAFGWFSTHPDAVVWTVGRVDGLATAWGLLAILAHLRARRTSRLLASGVSAAAFALALGSKEAGITVVGLIGALELLGLASGRDESRLRRAKALVPYFALTLAYLLVRRGALGTWSGGYGGLPSLSEWPSLAGHLLLDVVWMIVPLTPAEAGDLPGGETLAFVAAVLVWLVLGRLLFLSGRSDPVARPAFVLGILWSLASASVLLGLLEREAVGTHLRLWYLPSIGIAWVLGPLLAADSLAEARRLRLWLGLALLVVHGGLLGTRLVAFREAGAIAADLRGSLETIAASSGPRSPVLVARVPNHHRGAFVFSWGLPAAFRPPFTESVGQVFPIKGGPEVDPSLAFLPFETTSIFRWQGSHRRAARLAISDGTSANLKMSVAGHTKRWELSDGAPANGALAVRLKPPVAWGAAALEIQLTLASEAQTWQEDRRIPLPGRVDLVRIPIVFERPSIDSEEVMLRAVEVTLKDSPSAGALRGLALEPDVQRFELRLSAEASSVVRADFDKPLTGSPSIEHAGIRVTTFSALGTCIAILPAGRLDLLRIGTAPAWGRNALLALLPSAFGLDERWVYLHVALLSDPGNPYSVIASSQLLPLELDPTLAPVIEALHEQLTRQAR